MTGLKRRVTSALAAAAAVVLVAVLGLSGCATTQSTEPASSVEQTNTATVSADGTFTAQGVTLQVPDGWQAVSIGDVAGIAPSSGAGYIEVSEQDADLMSMGESIDSLDAMTGFVSTMVSSEGLSVDPASVAVSEKDGLYEAQLPLEETVDGTECQGVQVLVGSGDQVVVITALCPKDSYDADWSTYQSVLDSVTFSVGTAE